MKALFKEQLEKIRQSGDTNMLDTSKVQWIAFNRKWYGLVNWIAAHKSEYAEYIITGIEPEKDD